MLMMRTPYLVQLLNGSQAAKVKHPKDGYKVFVHFLFFWYV